MTTRSKRFYNKEIVDGIPALTVSTNRTTTATTTTTTTTTKKITSLQLQDEQDNIIKDIQEIKNDIKNQILLQLQQTTNKENHKGSKNDDILTILQKTIIPNLKKDKGKLISNINKRVTLVRKANNNSNDGSIDDNKNQNQDDYYDDNENSDDSHQKTPTSTLINNHSNNDDVTTDNYNKVEDYDICNHLRSLMDGTKNKNKMITSPSPRGNSNSMDSTRSSSSNSSSSSNARLRRKNRSYSFF